MKYPNYLTAILLLSSALGGNSLRAATFTWAGAGSDLSWSTLSNWNPSGAPGEGDGVFFNDLGATNGTGVYMANNVVTASRTIATLMFGQTNGFHNTLLNPGVTLTVSNNGTGNVVFTGTGVDSGTAVQPTASISGFGGTLVVIATNTGSAFNVRQGAAASGGSKRATLDLSFLDTLNLTAGRLLVAGDGSSTAANNRPNGTLYLAATNTIRLNGTAPALNVGDGSSNGGTEYMYLGQTNALFADSMTIGRQKCTSTLTFNSSFYQPALYIRGNSSARMATLSIGDNSAQSTASTADNGTIDLSAGSVDAQVDTGYIGRGMNGAGTGSATGTLSLGAGLLDVNTLEVAYVNINTAVANVNGTLNLNAPGTLQINTSLRLGRNPGATATANATLNVNGGTVRANSITTSLGANSTLSLSSATLALTNTAGSAAAPLTTLNIGDSVLRLSVTNNSTNIVVTSISTSSTTNNTISIVALPIITAYPAQYPLIAYSSLSYYDFLLGTLPVSSPAYQGYLSNNTSSSTIDLVITGGPQTSRALTWRGNVSGDWDTSTANWVFGSTPASFSQNDEAAFDDTATGTTTVNLTTGLTLYNLTVNNPTKDYTFTGAGSLTGSAGLTKAGAGSLTLGNSSANTFSGGVNVNGGTLRLSGSPDRLPTAATVTMADDGTAVLDLNNVNQTLAHVNGGGANGGNIKLGSATLTVTGSGSYGGIVSGSGLVIKTNPVGGGGGTLVLSGDNTYTGGTLVGGFTNTTTLSVSNQTGSGTGSGFVTVLTNGILSLGAGGTGGSVAAGVLNNAGTVRLDRTDDFTFSNVIVGPGGFDKRNTNTVVIPGTNSYTGPSTITAGALVLSNAAALGAAASLLTVQNDATARLVLDGGFDLAKPLTLACKQSAAGNAPVVVNASGSNTLSGQVTLTTGGSFWTFEVDAGKLTVRGNLTNVATSNTRTVRLRGAGVGEIQGAIANSTNNLSLTAVTKEEDGTWVLSGNSVYTGPTTVSAGTLVVNGTLAAGSAVANNAGTLGGFGTINGPVTVTSTGTLAPGDAGIGTLTVNNSLSLEGTTVMEVSHSAADKVKGVGTLTFGGTLQIVVVGSLTGGEVFKLFDATTYSGDFATYDLPALPSPLAWDATMVPVNGTLRVMGGAPPQPTIPPVSVSGGNLLVPVTTYAGYSYVLQSATNLTPTIYWSNESTNAGTGGTLTFTVPLEPGKPRKFLRIWVY